MFLLGLIIGLSSEQNLKRNWFDQPRHHHIHSIRRPVWCINRSEVLIVRSRSLVLLLGSWDMTGEGLLWYSYFKITNHIAGLIDSKLCKDAASLDLRDCKIPPEVCLFNKNVKTLHHAYCLYLANQTGEVNLSASNWTIIVSRSEFQSLSDERRSLLRKWNIISGWNINVRVSQFDHTADAGGLVTLHADQLVEF